VARRKLSAEEEAKLVADAESARGDRGRWDFDSPRRVRVPAGASAVLSVRLPVEELRALRRRAERNRISLSELVKAAVEAYVARSGPQITKTRLASGEWSLPVRYASPTETLDPSEREITRGTEGFSRPRGDRTDTKAS